MLGCRNSTVRLLLKGMNHPDFLGYLQRIDHPKRIAPLPDRQFPHTGAEARKRLGNFRRAAELCRAWADLELANAEAWRCLGEAQEGLGNHQDALNAFRKAKQHDPNDRSLDAAIDRSQKGIVSDFRNRYRK